MSSTLSLTTQDILNDRAARKAVGLVGCITGKPVPEMNFFGYSDVQSWRPSDPMNPHCFCFDCRGLWDRDATIDLQLLQNGHKDARYAYRNLIPDFVMPLHVNTNQPTYDSFDQIPDSLPTPRAAARRSSTGTLIASPVISPLPEPVRRDVMNESPSDRLRRDLQELRAHIYSDLIPVMDRRRMGACMGEPELSSFIHQVDQEEAKLQAKIAAIDLLLDD
jgi:hypothetical protein